MLLEFEDEGLGGDHGLVDSDIAGNKVDFCINERDYNRVNDNLELGDHNHSVGQDDVMLTDDELLDWELMVSWVMVIALAERVIFSRESLRLTEPILILGGLSLNVKVLAETEPCWTSKVIVKL